MSTWVRLLFKVLVQWDALVQRHGNILFHVSFLSLLFFFIFFRCAILSHFAWEAGRRLKRVIYPVFYTTGPCTLWDSQSLRFIWCLLFTQFPLLLYHVLSSATLSS
jgi:hypothetical protein